MPFRRDNLTRGIVVLLIALLAGCNGIPAVDADIGPPKLPPRVLYQAAQPLGNDLGSEEPVNPPPIPDNGQPDPTVIVDPGHGGRDPGAPASAISALAEKVIVLSIGNEVARRLRAAGVKVVSSRSTNRFIELDDRAALADTHQADLLVSIHADAAPNADARGATMYIARQASVRSRRAAEAIERALRASGFVVRGIRRADFRVLVGHSRPSVLVECGYLTNRHDARLLNTPSQRFRIAAAIAAGINNYLSR